MNSPDSNFPLETIYMDHYGPFNPSDGKNKALLTLRDAFSGYTWLFPVPDLTGKTVARNLEDRVFTQFGQCYNLVTDNAQAFSGEILKFLRKRWDINYSRISS